MSDERCCHSDIFRGASVYWQTRFYDPHGEETQPISASLTVKFKLADLTESTFTTTMSPPTGPGQPWTALWDSRGAAPGTVFWSIHTFGGDTPIAVEDRQFTMSANPANAANFP